MRPCSVPPSCFISRAGSELGQSRAAQTQRGPGAHLSATRNRGLRATSAAQLRARALNHQGPRQQNNPGGQSLWPLGLMLINRPGRKRPLSYTLPYGALTSTDLPLTWQTQTTWKVLNFSNCRNSATGAQHAPPSSTEGSKREQKPQEGLRD